MFPELTPAQVGIVTESVKEVLSTLNPQLSTPG